MANHNSLSDDISLKVDELNEIHLQFFKPEVTDTLNYDSDSELYPPEVGRQRTVDVLKEASKRSLSEI